MDINEIIIKEFSRQLTQMTTEQKMTSVIGELNNLKENGILDNIIKKIQNTIKNSDNILRKYHITYSNLREKDNDFISYLKEQIELLISNNVKKLIIELAKNGYLVSYFFKKNIPQLLEKPIFGFIKNINLTNIINENLENYYLDLKIPGSRYLLNKLINLANNCKNDYLNQENECRVGKNEIDLIKLYLEKKNYLKTKTYNEELLNDEILSLYLNDILSDFFKFYIYNNNFKNPASKKEEEFFLFLYSEKTKDDSSNSLSDKFLNFFLWVVCYHNQILKIIEVFNKLDKYFNTEEKNINITLGHDKQDLLSSIKENYNLFIFPIEKEEIKQLNKEKVNGIFYKIGESICHIITNINNVDLNNINLKNYCTDLNEVTQIFIQFNCNLKLKLKGHYSLITIITIIEHFQNNNSDLEKYKSLFIYLIKNIFDEKQFLLNNNITQAIEALIEQKNIIINNNLPDEICMKIFTDKLSQFFKLEEYKLELIKVVFSVPRLIKYSSLFFNYVFFSATLMPLMKPKMFDPQSVDRENRRRNNIKKFAEIKNQEKYKILIEINKEAEKNETLKEILMYIFEMKLTSYFDETKKKQFIKDNPTLLLTWLNFDYFQKSFDDIDNNNFGKLQYLGIIYLFSYLRIYLYYFVKFQLDRNNANDNLFQIHDYLFDKSNSDLGKMIILYIGKIFTLYERQQYFLDEYLNERDNRNWKRQSISSQNVNLEFFPIANYENSKNLLFVLCSKINNQNLNKNFIKTLEIKDLYYIVNFAYNEMKMKIQENNLEQSVILSKIKEKAEYFNFNNNINEKMEKLFDSIGNLEFFNNELMKSNLKLVFDMIRIYIISFIGYTKNHLFSLIFSENIISLIKVFYNEDLEDKFQFFENYYKIKSYLEEEYLNKDNYYPPYACEKCGKFYFHKEPNSFPDSIKNCQCNSKYFAIYYEQSQKEYIESGRCSKFSFCKYKGKLLEDYKKDFIIDPIINKCANLKDLLFNNTEINENTFSQIFIKCLFLMQVFIESKIGIISEQELIKEFNRVDLLPGIVSINQDIINYMNNKRINYHYFMNYFCDSYCSLLENNDCLKSKDIFNKFFLELDKHEYIEQKFNNIETNILTSITINPNFKNENYKYLSTAALYPNEKELKKAISTYNNNNKNNPLIMLNIFESINNNDNDINMLTHIDIINEFINSFSEEFNNLISRENSKINTIRFYLEENRFRLRLPENENSPLENQFDKYCESYNKISIEVGEIKLRINRGDNVIEILNDEKVNIINDDKNNQIKDNNKIEIQRTSINKLYNYLINIQNKILNQIINSYNSQKDKMKENIFLKNAVEQINKEIPIQLATKSDIFSLKYSDSVILSFEELFSFYSSKNIFNDNNDKIDYSKYSQIKFNLEIIEKELINNLLTGKKLFSKKQITYKFYSDPYDLEEKTKGFILFTKLYDKEIINDEEKNYINNSMTDLRRIILQNLEILIFYLIKENKYHGSQKISEIKIPVNLYLNRNFIQIFNDSSSLTINKLISIYEFIEEKIWDDIIVDRYVNSEFKVSGFWNDNRKFLEKFYDEEDNRELKNEMLTSLLIRFICRYLPYGSKNIDKSNNLLEMIIAKNTYLSKKQQLELEGLKKDISPKVSDAIDITRRLVYKNNLRNQEPIPNPEDSKEPKDVLPPKEEEEEEEERL